MKRDQIKRLCIVVVFYLVWAASAIYVHWLRPIKSDDVVNWVLSILALPCAIGVLFILLLAIWQSVERIYEYIKYGND